MSGRSPESGLGRRAELNQQAARSQFARLELSISISQRVMLVRPRKKNWLAVRVCQLFVLLWCSRLGIFDCLSYGLRGLVMPVSEGFDSARTQHGL